VTIDAPEPDFSIVRGDVRSITDGPAPSGKDVTCVIEVADSSLERDTEEKIEIYAGAGIPQYIVLNLRDRSAQVFSTPDQTKKCYPPPAIVPETGVLQLLLPSGQTLAVPLAEVLP
jgi:Uma2 family endonuclease